MSNVQCKSVQWSAHLYKVRWCALVQCKMVESAERYGMKPYGTEVYSGKSFNSNSD